MTDSAAKELVLSLNHKLVSRTYIANGGKPIVEYGLFIVRHDNWGELRFELIWKSTGGRLLMPWMIWPLENKHGFEERFPNGAVVIFESVEEEPS